MPGNAGSSDRRKRSRRRHFPAFRSQSVKKRYSSRSRSKAGLFEERWLFFFYHCYQAPAGLASGSSQLTLAKYCTLVVSRCGLCSTIKLQQVDFEPQKSKPLSDSHFVTGGRGFFVIPSPRVRHPSPTRKRWRVPTQGRRRGKAKSITMLRESPGRPAP